MTDQHSITPPSTIHPEMVDTYQELYSIVCPMTDYKALCARMAEWKGHLQ
jgi:hypothetical protein